MNALLKHKYLLIGIVLGALVVFLLSKYTTERKLNELQSSLEVSIEASVASTTELITLIGKSQATKNTEAVVPDCTDEERLAFEDRLARLDTGLLAPELADIDRLFSRCAPVQSLRRTLTGIDLARQFSALDTLIIQRKQIGSYTVHDEFVTDARTLIAHEERITQLSLDLVYLQREIIDLLLNGESVTSDAATARKERGYVLRTELQREAESALELRQRVLES